MHVKWHIYDVKFVETNQKICILQSEKNLGENTNVMRNNDEEHEPDLATDEKNENVQEADGQFSEKHIVLAEEQTAR